MELQGLQEALKVEIQCHQVNETWCYFSRVGVGATGDRGAARGQRSRAPLRTLAAARPPLAAR